MEDVTRPPQDVNDLAFPAPSEQLPFTGERYTSDISGPIRHQHHHRYLFAARYCAGRDVLDVACGEGYGSALLGTVARSVRGVDLDPETVAFAERNYGGSHVSFRQGDAAQLVEQNAFDVVVSFETIEHLVDHDAFLDGIRRALRPGGLLIISSPDRQIYTEADGHENEFHLRELDRAEFKKLIGDRFSNLAILEQDSVVGSLIGPEGGAPAPVELFSSADGRAYQHSAGNPRAHYLIALASDEPLPAITSSALDDASWLKQAEGHAAHAVALGREVVVRDAEIARLNDELQKRAGIEWELVQARNAVAELQREARQVPGLVEQRARLEAELAEARSTMAELEREARQVPGLVEQRTRLEAELAEARSTMAELEREARQVPGLVEQRTRLEAELAEARSTMAELEREARQVPGLVEQRTRLEAELAEARSTMAELEREARQVPGLVEQRTRLEAELAEARSTMAELEREARQVPGLVEQRTRLEAELAEARSTMAELEREARQVPGLVEQRTRLEAELAEARSTMAELEREARQVPGLVEQRTRLEAELAAARSTMADLQRETQQLQAQIDERVRQIQEVFASTSWRLTKPVRRIGWATAGMRRRLRAAMTPAAAPRQRAPSEPPRVLFIDWMVPTPDQDSGSLDLWNQLSLFQAMGYEAAFMPVVERPGDAPYAEALRKAGVRYLAAGADSSPEQLLQDAANDFDLILLNRIHVAARFLAHVRRCAPNARLVFNTVDLHFLREEREAALEGSPDKAQAAAQRRQDELRCMAEADATIVLSDEEGRLLSELLPDAAIHVIPFARGVSGGVPTFTERSGVLFVGGFLHTPNIDAATWLVEEIWPKVRHTLPSATLEIIGSNAPQQVRQLDDAGAGVVMRGFVQDLHPVLAHARVTVAPLRFGAGIKGKVAMSLAAGVPCVATPIASEGMGLVDGENILLGRDADALAAAIVQAHEDAALWERLSAGGHAVMRNRYSLESVGGRFIALARSLDVPVPAGAEKRITGLHPREWTL
ncbi:glycosyltransferase [Roseomonas sp. M0104]|uniref:Glycosyltransferase n=1 Tax=Teichococcus coralli TaxID=2545983 RepID=A0A845BGB3_9PROT|nr:glycosyltransferase [Pseudoroseomonas coralli]MXP64262.1 glycosyltransferase [Pseudoroseomonas coralli]